MKLSEFNRINASLPEGDKYSNPRNLAAGTIKQKDARMMSERKLDFMAFELLGWKDNATMEEKSKTMNSWGFKTADLMRIDTPSFDFISKHFKKIEDKRESLDYEIDGVVFKYNLPADIEAVGATDHHPRWQIALKFESKGKSTRLNDITWQVGRTSVLTPVAELDPVEVSGAVISRATLHNADFLITLDAQPGDYVYVERSGEVIPKIIKVTSKTSSGKLKLPTKCPSCSAKTEHIGVNLVCTGDSCRGREIQQISSWIRKTGIDGIGGKSLEKLFDSGLVTHYSDLYALTEEQLTDLLGKNGSKIYSSIEQTKEIPFNVFLAGLGIDSLGRTMGKRLEQSFSSLDELVEASIERLSDVEGISGITASNIQNGIRDTERYSNLFKNGLKIIYPEKITDQEQKETKKMKIYVTGKVEGYTKTQLKELIESKGFEFGNGVTKTTDYLVIAEKPGEKRQEQARDFGVKMIGWDEFKSKYLD